MDDAPYQAALRDVTTGNWLCFAPPRHQLTATCRADVLPLLAAVERYVQRQHCYAVGFVAYEAAPACDTALITQPPDEFPLAWFGLYAAPTEYELLPGEAWAGPLPFDWTPSVTDAEYRHQLHTIRDYIAAGDTYQVNFTYRLRSASHIPPWSLFLRLVQTQPPPCGAFLATDDWVICSASPELFFRQHGAHIESRPMKGTAARGLWAAQDQQCAAALRASVKERAENVMIVDMVRNDLGRIADIGSVRVPQLFTLEQYPTLWQLTSTVTARTRHTLPQLFQALFPPASITGAPKRRTMEIIAALETTPRHIYTGTIGFITPDGRSQFNVAIRTVLIDRQRAQAEYGVGSGIVWDSNWEREAAECHTKTRILNDHRPPFELLESILWHPRSGYFLLQRHLTRLHDSARYFAFPLAVTAIHRRLAQVATQLPAVRHKVRLLVDWRGQMRIDTAPLLPNARQPLAVTLAFTPVNTDDVWLYHKTTHRQIYEQAARAGAAADDVILFNQHGEITESTMANVAAVINGHLCTPPIQCGLLAGTYRGALLARGTLIERPITIAELQASPAIYLLNSVRGMRLARLVN